MLLRIFFLATALVLVNACFAQTNYGLKAGMNLSSQHDKMETRAEARVGYHFGGLLRAKLNRQLVLQPELLFSTKGFRAPSIYFAAESDLVRTYINLPVLVGYGISKNFHLLLGPELGYLLSAKSKTDDLSLDMTPEHNRFDLALDLAFSGQLSKRLGLDLRYSYGLNGMYDHVVYTDQFGNIIGTGKGGTNQVLQLGLFFWLGK